jgi:hypothetical protein
MTSITIKIDSDSVIEITNTQQVITLIQLVNSGAQSASASETKHSLPSSNTCIVWGVSQPYQNFAFTWTESYYWYRSTLLFELWNTIAWSSVSDEIELSKILKYSSNNFSTYRPEMDSPLFQLYNFGGSSACFGLAQDLTVNNTPFKQAPISGINVLNNELVQCSVMSKFAVIVSSYNDPGKVITSPPSSSYFTIDIGNSVTLQYDSTMNEFVAV